MLYTLACLLYILESPGGFRDSISACTIKRYCFAISTPGSSGTRRLTSTDWRNKLMLYRCNRLSWTCSTKASGGESHRLVIEFPFVLAVLINSLSLEQYPGFGLSEW